MPVREKAVEKLASFFERPPRNREQRKDFWPGGVLFQKYDDIYKQLIESIDWNRILLEATARCLDIHEQTLINDIDMPCADCLEAALLAERTFPEW